VGHGTGVSGRLMDGVKQRVSELSVESGHHMSKKAKKEQRATFREFMKHPTRLSLLEGVH